MMTRAQQQEIINELKSKKLPLDLLVEVQDHMREQMDHKMVDEAKTFDQAWAETRAEWEKDFSMSYSFWEFKNVTRFQKKIAGEIFSRIMRYCSLIISLLIVFSMLLLLVNREAAYYFLLFINIIAFGSGAFIMAMDYKILKTSFRQANRRNISFLQQGVFFIILGVIYIPANIFVDYDERFAKFCDSFTNIIHLDFTLFDILPFLIFYMWIFCIIFGVLSYLRYKKSIRFLEQKINFKL